MYESMVTNRDDEEHVKEVLNFTIFTSMTKQVKVYFTGDDDIIQGLVITSEHMSGETYFLTFISD